jgi:hypothetical protein
MIEMMILSLLALVLLGGEEETSVAGGGQKIVDAVSQAISAKITAKDCWHWIFKVYQMAGVLTSIYLLSVTTSYKRGIGSMFTTPTAGIATATIPISSCPGRILQRGWQTMRQALGQICPVITNNAILNNPESRGG